MQTYKVERIIDRKRAVHCPEMIPDLRTYYFEDSILRYNRYLSYEHDRGEDGRTSTR